MMAYTPISTCTKNVSGLIRSVSRQASSRVSDALLQSPSSSYCYTNISNTFYASKSYSVSPVDGLQALDKHKVTSLSLKLKRFVSPRCCRTTSINVSTGYQNMNLRLLVPKQPKTSKITCNMGPVSLKQRGLSAGLFVCLLVCFSSSEPSYAEASQGNENKEDDRDASPAHCSHGKKVLTDYSVIGIPGDGRCLFRSVAHGACIRSGKPAPNENLQRELADDLRDRVTSFKCGGFSFGISMLHVLFDGIAWKIFLENLASQAFDDGRPLATIPNNNRRLLAPRSPPLVKFIPRPEILKPRAMSSEKLEYKVFKFRSNDINFLKEKAKSGYGTNANTMRISRFNLIAALMWRCKVMSSCNVALGDKTSTLFSVADLRPRLSPPLFESYSGNAMLAAYSLANCKEIEKGPFGKLVDLVSEGPKRMTDEYARSMIDWFETKKARIHGDYMVSSWVSLGFENVMYPWGRPIHCVPVVLRRGKDICWLFPDVEGTIYALVSLPSEEMDKFQFHFHKFFSFDSKI